VGFFATSGILNRKGFFGGAQAFNPSSIVGLQLWLDATTGLFDATSGGNPVTTDGSTVARWEDQSSSGYHVTQATLANRPILKTAIKNNKNVIRFDGSNDVLISASIASDNLLKFTAFLVVSGAGGGGGNAGRIFERGTGVLNVFMFSGITTSIICGGSQLTASSSVSLSTFNLISPKWIGGAGSGTTTIRANKTLVGTGNTTSSPSVANTTYQIGNRTALDRAFNGDIGEIIIYNESLTDSQTDQVEAYLYSKWGLT
jgi:hypothetical protein